MTALPAVTQPTLPLESSTSHVSASVHPHWGTRPHVLLGAVRLQVSGASGCAPASVSVCDVAGAVCGDPTGVPFCAGVSAGTVGESSV